MDSFLHKIGMSTVDAYMAAVPRRRPSLEALQKCKIISHRGEHDNRTIRENTFAAFETARQAGVWGIEADIRWTADLVPMIHHDADTSRVFGKNLLIAQTKFSELRDAIPEIPTLEELVREFGGNTHLMLEIKEEHFPQLEQQKEILDGHLSGLKALDDYHFLALDPELFETFDIQPRQSCLTVAGTNFGRLSKATLDAGYGGLTGHFLLLNQRLNRRHQRCDQMIGTGFVRSQNCLVREINRGVEWIFTNDAVKLQKAVNALGDKLSRQIDKGASR